MATDDRLSALRHWIQLPFQVRIVSVCSGRLVVLLAERPNHVCLVDVARLSNAVQRPVDIVIRPSRVSTP